jgi:predicted alpha/beta superfamily hydrolase
MIGRVAAGAAVAGIALLALTGAARADAPIVGRVSSAALEEVREYTVRLPTSYAREPRRRYPVVYVLDGPPLDAHTADAAAANAGRGVSPELIVVGIPNMQRGGRVRDFLPPFLSFARRDGSPFTGGADRFLRFLKEELIPRIEREYRTAAPRMIAGHSLGAIFVCYSLTEAPRLFDARFAHSPAIWRDQDRIAGALSAFLSGSRDLGGFFYLSVGDSEGRSMSSGYHALTAVMQARAAPARLRWAGRITPGAVHETNVALATPDALAAYFAK